MLKSVWESDVQAVIEEIGLPKTKNVAVDSTTIEIPVPFPSPHDWRDHWIYFLLMDRFNNPESPPAHSPWDGQHGTFQGGTLNGVRQQLDYLQQLGVGAIWLSPVLKNCQYNPYTYHGYGIQDFLQIDPRFASDPQAAKGNPQLVEDEFRALVDTAHARGIYVILDVVLNHTGNVFEYKDHGSKAPWSEQPYTIYWRDEDGQGRTDWEQPPPDPPADAAVWPEELRCNAFFRRQGKQKHDETRGDFASLKELATDLPKHSDQRGYHFPVRDTLIRAHQYLIAKYDVDGFRIDTVKHIESDFARIFGNAMREFALSIGKKNFFTFGEIADRSEEKIARYIGRNAMNPDEMIGVDAALDFPLFHKLQEMAKGFCAPAEVFNVFERRKDAQRGILSSHGEASKFFVTFLDNHDQHQRFYFSSASDPRRFDDQVTLALGCLFALQGIPCLYYGTEQGLHGSGNVYEAVREALWGKPDSFDLGHPFYQAVQRLATLRSNQPSLRYGRQYFRPISGNGTEFDFSHYQRGVLALSRILNDQELIVLANTNTERVWEGEVIIDFALNPVGSTYHVLFSNKAGQQIATPGPVVQKPEGSVAIHEANGSVSDGPVRVLPAKLQPMEIQILGRK